MYTNAAYDSVRTKFSCSIINYKLLLIVANNPKRNI